VHVLKRAFGFLWCLRFGRLSLHSKPVAGAPVATNLNVALRFLRLIFALVMLVSGLAVPTTGANVAVTARSELIVSWQPPVPEQAPDQPAKRDPARGLAVRVTLAPSA
jgi:hypothetical protein